MFCQRIKFFICHIHNYSAAVSDNEIPVLRILLTMLRQYVLLHKEKETRREVSYEWEIHLILELSIHIRLRINSRVVF